MKKFSILFISLIIFTILNSALSETQEQTSCFSFPLHRDTRFGMSNIEIQEIEKQQDSKMMDKTKTIPYYVFYPSHSIAGFDRARIYYGFDEADKLFFMEYILTGPLNDDYLTVADMLKDKYGEPVAYCHPTSLFTNDKGGKVLDIPIWYDGIYINNRAELASRDYARYYEEWLLERDDGYIFIQHCFFGEHYARDDLKIGSDITINDGFNIIAYVYFDKETYDSFSEKSDNDL